LRYNTLKEGSVSFFVISFKTRTGLTDLSSKAKIFEELLNYRILLDIISLSVNFLCLYFSRVKTMRKQSIARWLFERTQRRLAIAREGEDGDFQHSDMQKLIFFI